MALLIVNFTGHAQNWDYIRTSGEYYYGVGTAETEAEASELAMADLVSMIATSVSSEFIGIEDDTNTNGSIDHKSKVLNCVRTYSQSTLTNVEKWVVGKEPNVSVRRYMRRSELARIYESRIAKAKDMIYIADEALQKAKLDMALQYYYWAYSLIRSVQRPNDVKDNNGHILVNWIPIKINEIMSDVRVKFDRRDGDFVDLLFTYKDMPVSSLEFNYSDGRTECQGSAKDGRGMMEMVPGYETNTYHINLEYEYKGQARGDSEMQSVLDVITKKVFPKAEMAVKGNGNKGVSQTPKVATNAVAQMKQTNASNDKTGINLTPTASQTIQMTDVYAEVMGKIISAIQSRNYSNANRCFTLDGLDMYNKLISYGTGRIVGTPNIKFFKGMNGTVVARGLQMSFSFKTGIKKTYVEDVVFTFNTENKIDNVAFGLGQTAENDILCKYAPGWSDETRELLMEFMENYKTAYCLKRLDYIRDIFADDAVIIVGNVVKRQQAGQQGERNVSLEGQNLIKYNRYTKDTYLEKLKQSFARNEFINIRFSNNEVQWLEKFRDKKLFAIQIGQEYNSSRYADKGYLFLLVDITDQNAPQIKIRTWQPNEVSMDKMYNAGDFYSE